jgi:mono/diheme cytochrome c family protein
MRGDQNDYNKGGMIAFAFSMVFTLSFFVYVSFIHKGVDLKEVADVQPGAEQTVAGNDAAAAGPKKIANIESVKDAWISTPELVDHGAAAFSTTCAMCHGPKGMGDGPAGAALNPKPRNLVEGKWKKGGTSLGLFDVVTHGLPGTSMAPFGHLPVNERWALVHYIRSITQNKVADNDAELKAKAPSLK